MPPLDAANGDAGALLIGLVNNMPAAAKKATEEQFMDLLATAADERGMHIKFFVAENDPGRAEETLHVLRQLQPDAVIVTGDEPRRKSMLDEPLWPGFGAAGRLGGRSYDRGGVVMHGGACRRFPPRPDRTRADAAEAVRHL